MTLSDLSIKNPVFAWMLMIGMIVFGLFGVPMGVSQMPDVDFPILSVSVTWEGAAPEVMEMEITDTLEDALISIEGLKEISSSSRRGVDVVTPKFNLDKDIDVARRKSRPRWPRPSAVFPGKWTRP